MHYLWYFQFHCVIFFLFLIIGVAFALIITVKLDVAVFYRFVETQFERIPNQTKQLHKMKQDILVRYGGI